MSFVDQQFLLIVPISIFFSGKKTFKYKFQQ